MSRNKKIGCAFSRKSTSQEMKTASKTKASIILLAAFILSGLSLIGQESTKTKSIKLYSNYSWISTQTNIGFDSTGQVSTVARNLDVQLGYFTPALSFPSANGNFQEIELSKIVIGNTRNEVLNVVDSTGKSSLVSVLRKKNNTIAFRYEYDVLLFKKKNADSKLKTYLGLSVNPYFSHTKYSSSIASMFTTSQNSFGALIAIIPRINYNINEKLFVDFNIPMNIIDMNVTSDITENPAIPVPQRSISTLNFSQLPDQFLVRFGLGFRV